MAGTITYPRETGTQQCTQKYSCIKFITQIGSLCGYGWCNPTQVCCDPISFSTDIQHILNILPTVIYHVKVSNPLLHPQCTYEAREEADLNTAQVHQQQVKHVLQHGHPGSKLHPSHAVCKTVCKHRHRSRGNVKDGGAPGTLLWVTR